MSDIRVLIQDLMPDLVEFRHDLHMHPELMYEENRTCEQVRHGVVRAGAEYVGGLAGGTGLVAWLPATSESENSKTVALRADMDALPIHEETSLPYASKTPGKMHACGHDGHTTILLGALNVLAKTTDRTNNVLFVFQPAEEGGAGADRLVKEGILEGKVIGKPVDVMYGLHGNPWIPQHHFTVRNGPMMAATDEFAVTLHGSGGHAAMPHRTADPVVALVQIVSAIQSICSRNVSPLDSIVFSTTTLSAGHAHNVIPDSCKFGGTMRTLLPETRVLGERRFREIVEGISSAMGCKAEIEWREGYPVTINDTWATDRFRKIANHMVRDRVSEEPEPTMGGEDFSYYGYKVPACFYFAGLKRENDESPAGLHTSRFDFNDEIIPDCIEMMCELALQEVI